MSTVLSKPAAGQQYLQHLPCLDGLRAVAVLLVILFHSFEGEQRNIPVLDSLFSLAKCGWCGVDMFFVLSGFLLTRIMLQSRSGPHFFKNFYCRRVLRIFPLYYVVLAAAGIMFLLVHPRTSVFARGLSTVPWLTFYGTNFLVCLQHSWLPEVGLNLNHFWSLCIEEHFYLFWPLVVFLTPVRALPWVSLGLAVALAGCRTGYFCLTRDDIAPYIFTPFRLDGLLIGSALACLLESARWRGAVERNATWAFVLTLVPFLLLVCSTTLDKHHWLVATIGYSIIGLFFASCTAVVATRPHDRVIKGLLANPVALWLGRHSYALYVFHYIVLCLFIRFGFAAILQNHVKSATSVMLIERMSVFVLACILAFVSWHALEKHFLRMKKKFV